MPKFQKGFQSNKQQQSEKQQNQEDRAENERINEKVFFGAKSDFQNLYNFEQIAISKDNSTLFVALQIRTECRRIRRRIFKFYDIKDNKVVQTQVIQNQFQNQSVKSAFFFKDSRYLLIAWGGDIQIWNKQEDRDWEIKSILLETQRIQYLNNVIINKGENLLIVAGSGLDFLTRHDDTYTWDKMENKYLKLNLKQISFNETEQYLIGQQITHTHTYDYIIIFEKHQNLKWILKRKITLDLDFNWRAILSFIFLREDSLIYNNRYVLWNKWSGKIIKKKKFHQNDETKSNVCDMLNQIIVLTCKETISLYKLEKNELIFKQDNWINISDEQSDEDMITEISQDGRYIITLRQWGLFIIARRQI